MRSVDDNECLRAEQNILLEYDPDTTEKQGTVEERQQKPLKTRQQVLVLVGLWFSIFVSRGMSLSIGVLYGDILEALHSTRKETGLIQSFAIGCTFGLGTLTGVAIKWFGLRTCMVLGGLFGFVGLFASWFATSVPYLIVFAGLMTGIGNSLLFFGTNSLVVMTFSEQKSNIIFGTIQFTAGVGGITLPLLLKTLRDAYDWRGSLLLSSCFYLNIIPMSWVIMTSLGNYIPFTRDHENSERMKRISIEWSKLLNPLFISFVITAFLSFSTHNNVPVVLTDFTKSKGFSYDKAVILLLVYNSALTLSCLLSGFARQFIPVHSVAIFSACGAIFGASVFGLSQANSWALLMFLTCTAAVGGGGMMTTTLVACLEVLDKDVFPIGLGVQSTLNGALTPLVGFIIGYMYDTHSSYDPPFLVFGIVAICGGLISLTTLTFVKCRARLTKTAICG